LGKNGDVFGADEPIDFEDIASPKAVTKRVAAGAFYNCLSMYRKSSDKRCVLMLRRYVSS
jgi:hypothetical protein